MALPDDRTIDTSKFPEKVRRFVAPEAPAPMKLMLARGLVPMKPLVQICALHQLAHAERGDVATTARDSALKMPVATVVQIAQQPLLPVVLDWMADVFASAREVLQAIVLNRLTDIDTLVRMAKRGDEEITEVIARNQQRLLESAALVEALYLNRNTRASTADRVIDFAARNDMDLSRIPGYQEILAAVRGEDIANRTPEQEAAIDAGFKDVSSIFANLPDDFGDELELDLGDGSPESGKARRAEEQAAQEEADTGKSAAGRIRDMNVAQKVRLASMGNKSERAILIGDTNKIVSRAVIRSPAVNDQEVMGYAGNKSLDEEVIRYIASQRKWTRHYRVKKALVENPKCPVALAMAFLPHLRVADLRGVSRSKSVPPSVSKAAKEMLKARMK